MRLEGSCHCRAVRFSLNSHAPYPYMCCYCSICRKTAGGGGYAINLSGEAATLEVAGEADVGVYQARVDGQPSPGRRHFCKLCGSALWLFDPRWPELVHPFASAIDTALPVPPARQHVLLEFAAPWVKVPKGRHEAHFDGYSDQSIEAWHKSRGLWDPDDR